MTKLPPETNSYWRSSTDPTTFDQLSNDCQFDVAIVGGGITGITAAYLLQKAGKKCVLLEADRLFAGTTGYTTAKITAQHDAIYDELIGHFGPDSARLYYDLQMNAKSFIEDTIKSNELECGLSKESAILYARTKKGLETLQKEQAAYKRLNIPFTVSQTLPFNEPIEHALIMPDQAQFHPLRYLSFLAEEFLSAGGTIFEQTPIVEFVEETYPVVVSDKGHKVIANFVLSCTHFPFYDRENLYFTRMHAERSYVLAVKAPSVEGMYLSVDEPKRSIRSVTINGESHLLVSGEGHKTGQGLPEIEHYLALENYAKDVFKSDIISYRWSAQDLYTVDNLPFIGVLSQVYPHTFLATGFRKWGMTNGTMAAHMLKDYVLGSETDEMALFDPERWIIDPSLKTFLKENANVAYKFIKGKLSFATKQQEEVKKGEGAIVSCDGRRAGAYRDEVGRLHVVDTTCTHLGCEVEWNNGDNTWDCPCHGSRFHYNGSVIEGPAKQPLKKLR
ncbi:FAD-dependent oxidoreductase [Paenalkalicoccus suaedae]|uniref:FAD-dependent oxidoreductase n=1 Tax=Paenalkalicoccus suaedae TaxID=2592382 RepID=A0A859FHP9_9BACI|nr:FAD-dependent oxidoreductase [Paenalkalicoccus suaedae]QKS72883.1 FAD-dependent oxidoreductase [Paenalkalicoccus suaedae]